jgi:hypothetical protein
MDHGAVIRTWSIVTLAVTGLLALPAAAGAATTPAAAAQPAAPSTTGATLVAPADGFHFDHLERAPMVNLTPSKDSAGKDEVPRWVLLATDREMTKTVRYCRQFVWAQTDGVFNWGCNRWAVGADQAGNDQLQALEPGVYYWQVVSASATAGGADIKSAVRAFAIDPETVKPEDSIEAISNQVVGTAFDDGSYLNLGAAAFVNSGVKVASIKSTRLATFAFRVHVQHEGEIDGSRSYVKVTSAAGSRFLKVKTGADGKAWALLRLTAAERKLRSKRFTYQAHLKSTKNGAIVRSQLRVVLVKAPKPTPKPPAWTPDN